MKRFLCLLCMTMLFAFSISVSYASHEIKKSELKIEKVKEVKSLMEVNYEMNLPSLIPQSKSESILMNRTMYCTSTKFTRYLFKKHPWPNSFNSYRCKYLNTNTSNLTKNSDNFKKAKIYHLSC